MNIPLIYLSEVPLSYRKPQKTQLPELSDITKVLFFPWVKHQHTGLCLNDNADNGMTNQNKNKSLYTKLIGK